MNKFYSDRDSRGRPAEYLLLELLAARGIPAFLNPAPESDLQARQAYDLALGYENEPWELWEVKVDWMSAQTGRICIEAPTLEHTKASRLVMFLPYSNGFYIHVFSVPELVELYQQQDKVQERLIWKYTHKLVGDQGIPAVLLPRNITATAGQPLWEATRELIKQVA